MNLLSWLIYIPLQIAFIPFTIVGASLVAWKQIRGSKKLGLSLTAIEVINGRWTMHIFGMRDDEATARLAAVLPNTSLAGLWLCLLPLWVKYRISGIQAIYPRQPVPGSEALADMIVARTLYFDRIIRRVITKVEQVVIMGAGYDMRAYGDLQRRGISFFELDQADLQQHKRASLAAAGIDPGHVQFVSVDFSRENAIERLLESGFETGRKTLFLWEGVTLYLSEAAVRKTLQEVRNNTVAGSVLVTDIYSERLISFGSKGATGKSLEQTGEGLDFGLDFGANPEQVLEEFVVSESWSVGETFFMGQTHKAGPYMVVAELEVRASA